MDERISFEKIWEDLEEFELSNDSPKWCKFSVAFNKWSDTLCQFTEDSTLISINQAKVILLDKYFDLRRFVNKKHRDRIGSRGHVCIFHVFEQTYIRLRAAELSLSGPLILYPPDPPPQTPPQIAGIFLGEFEE